tara:strand:+ start:155 stop:391 length:237 start_codon:yes stop_codon:yes gene_type:complete
MNILLNEEDFILVKNRKNSVRIKLKKSGLCLNITKKYFLFQNKEKTRAVCHGPIFDYIVKKTKQSIQEKELKFLRSIN